MLTFLASYPALTTFTCAELVFLLVRARDIQTALKRADQRTQLEQNQIKRGLIRGILIEAVVFVPASAVLATLVLQPLLAPMFTTSLTVSAEKLVAFHSTLGVVSYGFPFATLRAVVTRAALNTLKEFAELAPRSHDRTTGEPHV
jgi:hypothetical protein